MTLTDSTDDQLMALAALRYCLGRQSYIVSSCQTWLRSVWSQMTANTQHVVLRDIVDALVTDRAGDEHIDVPSWRAAVRWMAESMSPEQLQRVRGQVDWRDPQRVKELLP